MKRDKWIAVSALAVLALGESYNIYNETPPAESAVFLIIVIAIIVSLLRVEN